ncbi:MAG: methyltransferase domain-containing protein [Polyangiales bacterium]|jgi:hypothetical protein
MNTVDNHAVESKVEDMYERVAQDPQGEFHFEMGRALAERLGSFVASLKVGSTGRVVGVDRTDGQLDKARRLREQGGFSNIEYVKGYIDQLPFEDESFDSVSMSTKPSWQRA